MCVNGKIKMYIKYRPEFKKNLICYTYVKSISLIVRISKIHFFSEKNVMSMALLIGVIGWRTG